MINQQILEYIKQQLQQGVSREKIKSVLLANSWEEKDIEEGFIAVNNEQSPPDDTSVSQKQNVGSSPNVQKSTRTILVACLIGALFIGGGLFSYFYFRSIGETEQAPPVSANEDPKQTANFAPLVPAIDLQNVKGEDQEISAIKDCGVSKSLSVNTPINEIYPERDSALVCLGKNILNNCRASKTVLDTFNAGKVLAEVKTEGIECKIKLAYGAANEISWEAQKQFANMDIECPVGALLSFLLMDKIDKEELSSAPGGYAFSLYFGIGVGSLALNPEGLKKIGCVGTLLP